jgi:hypothetical protein
MEMTDLQKSIVETVKVDGIAKSHIKDLFNQEGIDLFNEVIEFYQGFLSNPEITERMNRIAQGNPIQDRSKWYEIIHYQHLKRALNLDDALIKLYLQDTFIDMAEDFYGSLPRVRNIVSWLHPQNAIQTERNSQVWHRDQEDYKIFKVFINFSNIGVNNGPTQYVKGTQHGGRHEGITNNMNGGPTDELKFPLPTEEIVDIQGDRGTIHFMNTNGLHKGGLVKEGIRCLTQANYLSAEAPAITTYSLKTFDCFKENGIVKGNYADKESETYKNLNDRQKYIIGP